MDRFNRNEDAPEWAKGAFDDGVRARYDGCSINSAPNADVIGTFSHKSWRAGWCDADAIINADGQMPTSTAEIHRLKAELAATQQQLLEARAHVEVMREAFELVSAELDAGAVKTAESLCLKYNTLFSKPPSEALLQRDYEQRALALEEAAKQFMTGVALELLAMAQEWRNKK